MAASNKTVIDVYNLIGTKLLPYIAWTRLTTFLTELAKVDGNASFRATTAALLAHHNRQVDPDIKGAIDAPPAIAKGPKATPAGPTKRVAVVLNLEVPEDEDTTDVGHTLHHASWQLPGGYVVSSVGKVVETRPKGTKP